MQAAVGGLTISPKLNLNHFTVKKLSLTINRKYFEANKRVWEHGRDYYRISNEYQQYEHNFDEFGIGASELTEVALAMNMDNLDQWTSQAYQR